MRHSKKPEYPVAAIRSIPCKPRGTCALYLTREEERIYNGEYGEALQKAIRVIVKVGEALGASRLIRIRHAHVSGISYNNIGDAGLGFIEDLYRSGARFKVETTINPVGTDMDNPYIVPGVTPEFVSKQAKIIKYLSAMGAKPVMTCTPYYVDTIKPGWHLAWGESSAVAYANSVIGAWTNREGGPLALLAGILGKTYYAGVHLPENRLPRTRIVVEKYVEDQAYAGIIGKLVAEKTRRKPPLVQGL
ncbi:MAG: aconitase X catalytic domain-containing protein, partial [Desulfurococcales archaeon]|nr:aconitase X catalytic domain-containing protein [Desulfurococcales archaeon]